MSTSTSKRRVQAAIMAGIAAVSFSLTGCNDEGAEDGGVVENGEVEEDD